MVRYALVEWWDGLGFCVMVSTGLAAFVKRRKLISWFDGLSQRWQWALPVLGLVLSALILFASFTIAGKMALPNAKSMQSDQRLVLTIGGTLFVLLQAVSAQLLFHQATRPEADGGASDHGTVNLT